MLVSYDVVLASVNNNCCNDITTPNLQAEGVAAARQQAEESAAAMLAELQGKLLELEKQAAQVSAPENVHT